jgi:3-(3-hydroxy-phenyl)propionate hydroxylase
VLLNLAAPGAVDVTPWTERVRLVDAEYAGSWDLPVVGTVSAPDAVLIRPDGYVAWAGEADRRGLSAALSTWFGPPAGEQRAG